MFAPPVPPLFTRPDGGLVVIGHRGCGRGLVGLPDGEQVLENTLASLLAAAELGADWVQTDVCRTADAGLVLHHDTVLDDGTAIVDLTVDQCRARGLCTLTDALEALPVEVGVIVTSRPVLADVGAALADTTHGRLALALADERVAHPARPLLTCSADPVSAVVLTDMGEEVGNEVPVAVLAVEDNSPVDLVAMTVAASEIGAAVVCAHTTTYLSDQAAYGHHPHTLRHVLATGRTAGVQYVAWCPSVRQSRLLTWNGVDAVCVDDLPTVLRAQRAH